MEQAKSSIPTRSGRSCTEDLCSLCRFCLWSLCSRSLCSLRRRCRRHAARGARGNSAAAAIIDPSGPSGPSRLSGGTAVPAASVGGNGARLRGQPRGRRRWRLRLPRDGHFLSTASTPPEPSKAELDSGLRNSRRNS
eukprot:9273593-Alexandrium_andersonii.AAC.1